MAFSWDDSRRAFTDAAEWFVGTTALVGNRWELPGLGAWDIRALVGHTSRALLTVETYSPVLLSPSKSARQANTSVRRGRPPQARLLRHVGVMQAQRSAAIPPPPSPRSLPGWRHSSMPRPAVSC